MQVTYGGWSGEAGDVRWPTSEYSILCTSGAVVITPGSMRPGDILTARSGDSTYTVTCDIGGVTVTVTLPATDSEPTDDAPKPIKFREWL